jgi:hypothetical protein
MAHAHDEFRYIVRVTQRYIVSVSKAILENVDNGDGELGAGKVPGTLARAGELVVTAEPPTGA